MTPPSSHTARKRFGQNFLQDPAIIERIVAAIGPRDGEHLVEIGPGLAALTQPIVNALGEQSHLQLLEIDRDLAARLEQKFQHDPRIAMHIGDALDVDFIAHSLQAKQPLRVFGNLPYNISTPLIFHLLAQACPSTERKVQHSIIKDMHFMLQREVVDRMAAPPGNKTYGRLSVMTQYYCRVEHLFDVPPECFQPQPKVMSAIVRLEPYQTPPCLARDTGTLDKVVKAAFAQRRKTLRNTLKGIADDDVLEACAIDPGARAETLDIENFVAIANRLTA